SPRLTSSKRHCAADLIVRSLIVVPYRLGCRVRLRGVSRWVGALDLVLDVDGVINPRPLELSRVSRRFVIACQRHKDVGSQREPTRGTDATRALCLESWIAFQSVRDTRPTVRRWHGGGLACPRPRRRELPEGHRHQDDATRAG